MLARPAVTRYPTAGARSECSTGKASKQCCVDTKRGAWLHKSSIRQREAFQVAPGLFRSKDAAWHAVLQPPGVNSMAAIGDFTARSQELQFHGRSRAAIVAQTPRASTAV